VITSIRSRNQHYTALQRVLVRLTMPLADVVVLNGAHAHDFAIHVEGARPERIRLIPNGIDIVHAPILATNGLCSLLNLPASSRLVGSLGRLSYEKGHDQLVAAFALLGDQSVHLVLIGDGNEREQLRLQAELLGIAARVHFIGQRQDAKELISDLAVFVHPSRQEGMSNALLEAMAAGRPIVATAIDGNRELISDGIHGWLVPPEDPGALAQAIRSALENPVEAQRRGMAAQARAAQAFSMSAMVDAWERVLQS
jgi:glycosyltransferase involved in cell wall biosynthesis